MNYLWLSYDDALISSHSLFSYYYFQSEMIIMNELRHAQHTHLIHIQAYEIMFYISITSPFELKNKKNEL